MSDSWPVVALGEVLRHRKVFTAIDDLATYRRCRVQTQARGVVLRDTVGGAEIKTKQQQVCRSGDFLVAEIDAKVGGYGLVPPELDGAIVSSHYFLFEVDEAVLDRHFLGWYIRTSAFRDQVAAQGSTNYAAVRPRQVLDYTIPLPPLADQRRIVAHIEAVAERVEEARRLRGEIVDAAVGLCRSMVFGMASTDRVALSELVRLRRQDVDVSPHGHYDFAGVYCFGRGMFRGPRKAGAEFAYSRLTRLRAGNFVYPKLMAWEGALTVVPPEFEGLVVSPEFPVFEVDRERVLPETLDIYFRTPSVWPELSGASTGTNVRRRRLHPEVFLAHAMPLPCMRDQETIRDVKERVDDLQRCQVDTSAVFDSMLPAVLDRAFGGQK